MSFEGCDGMRHALAVMIETCNVTSQKERQLDSPVAQVMFYLLGILCGVIFVAVGALPLHDQKVRALKEKCWDLKRRLRRLVDSNGMLYAECKELKPAAAVHPKEGADKVPVTRQRDDNKTTACLRDEEMDFDAIRSNVARELEITPCGGTFSVAIPTDMVHTLPVRLIQEFASDSVDVTTRGTELVFTVFTVK